MKLYNLHIKHFRGATQPVRIDFDPNKKITMIFGENGNGKSTISDAMIALCTDGLGSIRDKSSTDKTFIRSLGCKPEDVSIKLVTSVGDFSAQLNYSGASFIKTQVDTKPQVRHLRRSHIIQLIDSEPSKKYEVLRDYIDVSNIMKCEDELRKARKTSSDNYEKTKLAINFAVASLNSTWQTEGYPMGTLEEWARAESGKDISKLIKLQSKLDEILRLWMPVKFKRAQIISYNTKYRQDQANERTAFTKLEELEKKNPTRDFSILEVLSEAQNYIHKKIDVNSCPVCDQSVEKEKLLSTLASKIATMTEFQTAQKQLAILRSEREKTESTFRTLIESFIEDLNAFKEKIALIGESELNDFINDINNKISNNDKYKAVNTHFSKLDEKMGEYEKEVTAIEKSKNQHSLIKQQYFSLLQNSKYLNEAEKLADATQRALDIVEKTRKEFIDKELSSISVDIENLYLKMHPGENIGGIKLFLKPNVKNSLELNADFHSEQSITPQSLYSESHLDTLGICIFIALAKKYSDGYTILILDDVVMSVDENHLDRFIDMLHDQVGSFAHIFITTHYRPWKDRYRFSRAPSHQVHFIELKPWSLQNGIKFQNGKIDIETLKECLDADYFDRQRISSLAGTILENVLDFLSVKYFCKLPRKPKNDYVLRELLDCLSSKLQKALKVEKFQKLDGIYDYSQPIIVKELKPEIDALKQLSAIRNQVGAHFNFDGSLVSDRDVLDFGNLVYEFAQNLICPESGNFPDKTKSGSYHETASGAVRLYPLVEP